MEPHPDPHERAESGSPGSRPERGAAPVGSSEPNVVCAPPSPPAGKAAGGFSPAAGGRPEVLEHAHTLLSWAIPVVAKFPRCYRFTLGDRIQLRLYDVLELLVRATYAARNHKRSLLGDANVALEVLRHELRFAYGLRLFGERQVEHATRLIDAVGRQVGGWSRSLA